MSTQGCTALGFCQQTHKAPKPPQNLINPQSQNIGESVPQDIDFVSKSLPFRPTNGWRHTGVRWRQCDVTKTGLWQIRSNLLCEINRLDIKTPSVRYKWWVFREILPR